MKFTAIACALLGVSAAAHTPSEQDDKLAQLISSALAGAPPGEIREAVEDATKDKEGNRQVTTGKTKNYKFHWQYVCAFTKWTPTNQWLHAAESGQLKNGKAMVYDPNTMTLERFGFIGEDKKCYWGMTGVEWVTPLKVSQIVQK